MSEYCIICPCYWVNENLFEENLQSWISEVKPNRILLGVNRAILFKYLKKLQKKYPVIELIDQTYFETLGGCLADLIKRVQTEWFVYVHSDVRITPYAFLIMQQYQKEDVGIIESHREEWDGKITIIEDMKLPQHKPKDYYFRNRSFSGLQLFQKKAIMSLVNRLEDDYLYRNEDMIFHAECFKNGYKYCKTWAMHIHQIFNTRWSHGDFETHVLQHRGFIKYTDPNEVTKKHCLNAVKYMKRKYKMTLSSVLEFCYKHNNYWAEVIAEEWDLL